MRNLEKLGGCGSGSNPIFASIFCFRRKIVDLNHVKTSRNKKRTPPHSSWIKAQQEVHYKIATSYSFTGAWFPKLDKPLGVERARTGFCCHCRLRTSQSLVTAATSSSSSRSSQSNHNKDWCNHPHPTSFVKLVVPVVTTRRAGTRALKLHV